MTIWTAVTFGVAAISAAATVADQGQLFNGIALPLPTRELEWKDVNILSLSDTHGWLLGHQHATWPEPNYSGDYGNFASFVTHMRAIADAKGVDLLLVDAGDHHDGSGLVSSSAESASKADEIFSILPYDIIAIGNHELYSYASAKEIYDHCERWGGRYVTSNVNITVEEDGQAVSKPIGERYVKFETKQRVYLNTQMSIAIGRKVTAFGIIFNFQAHDRNLTIQSTSALAHEPWFLETIKDAPDYFVLVGHMPARGETSEWAPVFEAIRRVHPYVPVYVFGGHTHVRDCTQYDSHSIAVVPGRYMETVAFTSSSLPVEEHPEEPLSVARRYIDGNPLSYRFHTKTSPDDFNLPIGRNITLELLRLSSELNISRPLGVAPKDLFLARYKYGHPNSVLTEWVKHVLPSTIIDRKRSAVNRTIIVQSGSLRFDVFQGRFDRNDELTLSPFYNHFYYTTLPYRTGKNVLEQLNRAGASKLVPNAPSTKREEEERVDRLYNQWLSSQQPSPELGGEGLFGSSDQIAWNSGSTKKGLTLGYVTEDACPGIGDDIEHIPLPHDLDQPDFLGTVLPADLDDDDEMDVVIMDFSLDDFLVAVKVLDPKSDLKASDMRVYADGVQLNEIWGQYAKTAWQ